VIPRTIAGPRTSPRQSITILSTCPGKSACPAGESILSVKTTTTKQQQRTTEPDLQLPLAAPRFLEYTNKILFYLYFSFFLYLLIICYSDRINRNKSKTKAKLALERSAAWIWKSR
jgi:hypothetical protein